MQSDLTVYFHHLSQALLLPVMLLLCVGLAVLLFALGNTLRTWLERAFWGGGWRNYMNALRQGSKLPNLWRSHAKIGLAAWVATRCQEPSDEEAVRSRLAEAELVANRSLGFYQVLIRIGPMLGLIGTLLPLGPALQQLSQNNLSRVGESLDVAFTTTVFGIFIGAVAYGLHVVHRSWFEQDLCDMECVLERLVSEKTRAQ